MLAMFVMNPVMPVLVGSMLPDKGAANLAAWNASGIWFGLRGVASETDLERTVVFFFSDTVGVFVL